MIDGILHLTGSNCRVVFLKNKLFVTQNKHRNELHERKAAGDPLEPLQSMLICRGPLVLRSRIKAIIFRCFSDPHLLDVCRIGISTLTAGVAGDLVWSRHQSLDPSSVFRFNPPLVYYSSPIGRFARSTFSRWYLVGSPCFRMATHESGFSTPSMKIP